MKINSILASGFMYELFGLLIGGNASRSIFVKEYIRPNDEDAILDIGCGPGSMFPFLPSTIKYTGFDSSQEYISLAKKRFGERGAFFCENIKDAKIKNHIFDIAIASGVIHHLDDTEVLYLFNLVKSVLKNNGRFITIDPVYEINQSPAAKWIISQDRGLYVRDFEQYRLLANTVFERIKVEIRHDLLRMPYTHIIMECEN